MKHLLFFVCLFQVTTSSAITLQRSAQSSLSEYRHYLQEVNAIEFKEAYYQQKSIELPESESLDQCLDSLSQKNFSKDLCEQSVKELTQKPTNAETRQLLIDLLQKFPKSIEFYQTYRLGLMHTENHHTNSSSPLNAILIKKAFERTMTELGTNDDYVLLVDGVPTEIGRWDDDNEVHQFSLITNSYAPFIRISKWSAFLSVLQREMKAFSVKCPEAGSYSLNTVGLMEVQLFHSRKCLVKNSPLQNSETEHLNLVHHPRANIVQEPQLKSDSTWIYMATLALLGGLAYGLKDKQVSIEMPSF